MNATTTQTDRDSVRIGVIGLGTMGGGMAHRLLDEGLAIAVCNRTADRRAPLEAAGAWGAATPAELAGRVDTVLLSLADQAAVEAVLFGADGVVESLPAGGVVVNTSTVAPSFARSLAGRLAQSGHRVLDACVVGNGEHARQGELRFLVGGEPDALEAVRPVLDALGKEIAHLGPHGRGASMKVLLNMVMGIEMQALAEAAALGVKAGLPAEAVLRTIAGSGFGSPVMRFKAGVMTRRAFGRPDFRLALMRKDLALARAEAQELGVPLAAAEGTYSVLTAAVQQGMGDLDCAAVLAYMERISGVAAVGDEPGDPASPAR